MKPISLEAAQSGELYMSTLEMALNLVKAHGYRVSKPKEAKAKGPLGLNAVGKPYGENYDPNYKMKYRPKRYAYP